MSSDVTVYHVYDMVMPFDLNVISTGEIMAIFKYRKNYFFKWVHNYRLQNNNLMYIAKCCDVISTYYKWCILTSHNECIISAECLLIL